MRVADREVKRELRSIPEFAEAFLQAFADSTGSLVVLEVHFNEGEGERAEAENAQDYTQREKQQP